jgi:hypothetical protein
MFNIHKFYVLSTQWIYIFYMGFKTNTIIPLYSKIGLYSGEEMFTARYDLIV